MTGAPFWLWVLAAIVVVLALVWVNLAAILRILRIRRGDDDR